MPQICKVPVVATPAPVHEDRARGVCSRAEGHLEAHVALDCSRPFPGTGQAPRAHISHSGSPAVVLGPRSRAGRRPRVPVCICAPLPVPRDPDPRPAPRRLRFTVPSSTREPHHESPAPCWRLRPASKAVLAPRPVEMPDRKSRLSHPPLPGMSRWFCIARRPVAAE